MYSLVGFKQTSLMRCYKQCTRTLVCIPSTSLTTDLSDALECAHATLIANAGEVDASFSAGVRIRGAHHPTLSPSECIPIHPPHATCPLKHNATPSTTTSTNSMAQPTLMACVALLSLT